MFGLGKKQDPAQARATLAEAMLDIGGEDLSRRALRFFDDRGAYESWNEHSTGEPMWVSEGRDPSPAETASDIFRELLIADQRAVIIDWATGAEGILDDADTLFARAGKPRIDAARREALLAQYGQVERGKAMLKLMAPLEEEATSRGLAIHWWNTEADAHIPLLLTPEAHKRWGEANFGKNFPVLK
jgi:hypothetical protein